MREREQRAAGGFLCEGGARDFAQEKDKDTFALDKTGIYNGEKKTPPGVDEKLCRIMLRRGKERRLLACEALRTIMLMQYKNALFAKFSSASIFCTLTINDISTSCTYEGSLNSKERRPRARGECLKYKFAEEARARAENCEIIYICLYVCIYISLRFELFPCHLHREYFRDEPLYCDPRSSFVHDWNSGA